MHSMVRCVLAGSMALTGVLAAAQGLYSPASVPGLRPGAPATLELAPAGSAGPAPLAAQTPAQTADPAPALGPAQSPDVPAAQAPAQTRAAPTAQTPAQTRAAQPALTPAQTPAAPPSATPAQTTASVPSL